MDPISDFVAKRCVLEKLATVDVKGLKDAYLAWAQANDLSPLGARAFNDRLTARGCEQVRRRTGDRAWEWLGIRLRTDADEPPPAPDSSHSSHSSDELQDSPYTRARMESYGETRTSGTSETSSGAEELDL
jgi:phage/plasmid-associated DNA primase